MAGLGDPVSGEYFINREQELGVLQRRLDGFLKGEQKRNIAIIGHRKIGKTSLTSEFIKKNKSKDCLFVPIYIPENSPGSLMRRAIGELLAAAVFHKTQKMSSFLNLNDVIALAREHFPKTVNVALNFPETDDDPEAFRRILILFDALQKESGLPLVIIFDEFQRLADPKYGNAIDSFREMIPKQALIWYLISGSSVGMLTQIVSSSDSALFGHFEQQLIGEFDFTNSVKLIQHRLKDVKIGQTETAFFYELTNGNPYYLDLISFRIKDLCAERGIDRVNDDVIVTALTFELFTAGGGIYTHLTSLIEQSFEKRGFGTYVELIKAIAKGNTRLADIGRESNIELTSLPRYVKKLIDLDFIKKVDGPDTVNYLFIDEMFQDWLKNVFLLREDTFSPDITTKKKVFEKKMTEILGNYKTEIGKGNEARVRELFQALDGTDRIGDYALPKFDSVSNFNFQGVEIDIVAQANKQEWFVEVTDSYLDIGDAKEFLKKLEKIGRKEKNKILVGLNGIKPTLEEFCKQNDIRLLRLSEINLLLKKYSKKRILL
ncbi:MAG: ATP-binding protein [Candidatus Micrarchaeota archaeon]